METVSQPEGADSERVRDRSAPSCSARVCKVCGEVIPPLSLISVCMECQREGLTFRQNPKNFGKRWRWLYRRYAPVQMVYGTLQSNYIELSARRAWERFEAATGRTRAELKRDGYRVKAIYITPDFSIPNA